MRNYSFCRSFVETNLQLSSVISMTANCESVRIIGQLNLNRKCDYVHSVRSTLPPRVSAAFLSARATRINLSSILGGGARPITSRPRSPSIGTRHFSRRVFLSLRRTLFFAPSFSPLFSRYPLFLFPPRPCPQNNRARRRVLSMAIDRRAYRSSSFPSLYFGRLHSTELSPIESPRS